MGALPNVLVYNTTYFEGVGRKKHEKHDCFNLHAMSFSSGREVFFLCYQSWFHFFVVALLSFSPSVKIQHNFLPLSCDILFNLQTGDVKGAKSSSSGRNVEWTRGRKLVLHSGETALCWAVLEAAQLEPAARGWFKTNGGSWVFRECGIW